MILSLRKKNGGSIIKRESRLLGRLSSYSDRRSKPSKIESEYQFVGAFAQLGLVEKGKRKKAEALLLTLYLLSTLLLSVALTTVEWGLFLVSAPLAISLTLFLALLIRKKVIANYHRKLLFELSFFLENLLLLCSAGLGLSAALHSVTLEDSESCLTPFFVEFLRRLENGESSQQATCALAEVSPISALRHVFVQLDLGTGVGAPVTDVLTALNEYSAEEWRLCVESSIRRIEVAVVFPVFAAVFGFLLLVASGPIVSIANLDLKAKSNVSQAIIANRSR